MSSALVLGGTGVIGRAAAGLLAAAGWSVDVVGRDQTRMPPTLPGVSFRMGGEASQESLANLVGEWFRSSRRLSGLHCFRRQDAPSLRRPDRIGVDALEQDSLRCHLVASVSLGGVEGNFLTRSHGRLRLGDRFVELRRLGRVDVPPLGVDIDRLAREPHSHHCGQSFVFVKRVLDQRPMVFFNRSGHGGDHTTAAVNTGALIEAAALQSAWRILNSADPDAPNGIEIARAVANHMNHTWEEVVLEGGGPVGDHPWTLVPPVHLDLSASEALGYRPVGTFAETVGADIDWILSSRSDHAWQDDPYFAGFFPYEDEDRLWTSSRKGQD